jgi:uncharacterized protein YjbI with pentapeptide repeats
MMQKNYFTDKTFHRENTIKSGEYESCIFNECNFLELDFSGSVFANCTFNSCNLSMVKLTKTAFREVVFKDCKMLGLRFDNCNELGLSVSFENCQLNHSSFYKTKIKKTVFKNSQLQEVDFAEADLTNSVFDNSNLLLSVFEFTILEKADFRTAYNYTINPENNRIKKAKFSISGVAGLLDKYDIEIE